MKMTRSNAFVVALLFSLAACGGQSRSSGSGTNNGTNVGTNNGTNTGGDPGTVTDGGTDGGTGGTDGGTGVTDGGSTPSVVSVALTSANASIVAGMSQQYAAVATYSDSSEQDVTASATWSVDPAGLGSIDASGNFLGLAAGAGTISATFGGVTGSTSIAVTENVLLSLSLTPSAGSGPLGVDVPFTAMGIFSYGSRDLTAAVTWSTSDPTVATISPTGLLHPVSPGSVEIQAASGPITASTTFTVTDGGTGGGSPYVIGLALTPADASFVAGMSQQYAAVATYSDSSVRDVTATATWSVAPAGLGTFDALGNFVAVAAGAGTISATFGGVTGSTSIAVTENVLQSLSLTPSDDSGPLGVDVPFTAMGIFTNGAQDLTSVVTWTSSDPSIATISSAGVLHPVAPGGPITITATTSGAMAASTTFTVTAAKLTDIAVVPATSTIAQFTTASLQAIGYYSDNTQVDLSDVATWSSDSTAVVLSNGIAYDTGDAIEVAYGASPGSATVTASFGGISDNATVTVTSATLLSIAVDPATIALPAGLSRQVTVTGTFSDGTTQDLTALATWSSSAPAIASVSNAMGSAGLVSLLAPGHATVTANVVVGAVTLTADVSVAVPNAFVKSIAVTGSPTLPAGYKTQFTAIATYSDGSSLDVTKRATWTSSNTEVATISTASPTQGFATGITSGTTIISAKLGGVSGSTSLTVSNARLVSLVVTPGDFTVGVDEHQQLTAIGTFSDGSALDLTTQCMWRSYDKHTAWVSRAGVVTGTSAGTTAILARKRNIKAATVDATVQ